MYIFRFISCSFLYGRFQQQQKSLTRNKQTQTHTKYREKERKATQKNFFFKKKTIRGKRRKSYVKLRFNLFF